MKITTKTGSVYVIDDRGVCQKFDKDGRIIGTFKAFSIKAVPTTVTTWDQIVALPKSQPEVGKRLYVAGLCDDWLSTVVTSIEGELNLG